MGGPAVPATAVVEALFSGMCGRCRSGSCAPPGPMMLGVLVAFATLVGSADCGPPTGVYRGCAAVADAAEDD